MMSLSEWEAELKCSATGKPGELFRMLRRCSLKRSRCRLPERFPVAEHFNSASHSPNDIMICGLKRCSGDNTRRKNQEMRLIFELGTLKPNGLNINLSFISTCTFLLMRTHVTHTLTHTFLFHSCVSRARTSHASARSPLGYLYGVLPAKGMKPILISILVLQNIFNQCW